MPPTLLATGPNSLDVDGSRYSTGRYTSTYANRSWTATKPDHQVYQSAIRAKPRVAASSTKVTDLLARLKREQQEREQQRALRSRAVSSRDVATANSSYSPRTTAGQQALASRPHVTGLSKAGSPPRVTSQRPTPIQEDGAPVLSSQPYHPVRTAQFFRPTDYGVGFQKGYVLH